MNVLDLLRHLPGAALKVFLPLLALTLAWTVGGWIWSWAKARMKGDA